ncbi:MAG: glycosyltransferase family 2 protein [Alphaproteobacteria bacterium]|nr:glycosyltransferase family 2 protein [Alphaproteobacteria bacterium]MBF0249701.1 glycosyltransferase family 2 protein [Alphaproteobacteria bacterium]
MTSKTMPSKPKSDTWGISYVIPVYNEERAIVSTIERVRAVLESLKRPYEIIVVDDGSGDASAERAKSCKGVTVIRHPSNAGYGASLKTGITHARYDFIGIVDADGSYEIEKIAELATYLDDGFDMAVATRSNVFDHDGFFKKISRKIYIEAIRLLVNRQAQDPNSGLRMFTRSFALRFFPFLCNTFSFTTSLTVFGLGDARFVKYIPSDYQAREGKSKVRHFRDTLRTIQLIVQGVTFFNPVKIFILLALAHVVLVALPSLALMACVPTGYAWIYFLTGTAGFGLLGIGALGDIIRISAMRNRELHMASPFDATDE